MYPYPVAGGLPRLHYTFLEEHLVAHICHSMRVPSCISISNFLCGTQKLCSQTSFPYTHSLTHKPYADPFRYRFFHQFHLHPPSPSIPGSLKKLLFHDRDTIVRGRVHAIKSEETILPFPIGLNDQAFRMMLLREVRLIRLPPLRPSIFPQFAVSLVTDYFHFCTHGMLPIGLPAFLEFADPAI